MVLKVYSAIALRANSVPNRQIEVAIFPAQGEGKTNVEKEFLKEPQENTKEPQEFLNVEKEFPCGYPGKTIGFFRKTRGFFVKTIGFFVKTIGFFVFPPSATCFARMVNGGCRFVSWADTKKDSPLGELSL